MAVQRDSTKRARRIDATCAAIAGGLIAIPALIIVSHIPSTQRGAWPSSAGALGILFGFGLASVSLLVWFRLTAPTRRFQRLALLVVSLFVLPFTFFFIVPELLVPPYMSDGGGTNAVVYLLRDYAEAQEEFISRDRYGIGRRVYANPIDGVGLADLHRLRGATSDGEKLGLLGDWVLRAGLSSEHGIAGAHFVDVTQDADGQTIDYTREYIICAVARSWQATLVLRGGAGGCRLYFMPDRMEPVTQWPDIESEGWIESVPRGWVPFWP